MPGSAPVEVDAHYRLDDLRGWATSALAAVGLSRGHAAALSSFLLWFDQAGFGGEGVATLPTWLERLQSGEIRPDGEGRVVVERTAAATVDGAGGIAPLILERATRIAREKARDVGVGIVRVTGIVTRGPVLPIAMDAAIGPMVAALLGPEGHWALAIPSAGDLPLVYDSALALPSSGSLVDQMKDLPWPLLVRDQEWIVQAVAVTAFEPLAGLHERVRLRLEEREPRAGSGMLSSRELEARAARARLEGMPLTRAAVAQIADWSARLGLHVPEPRATAATPAVEGSGHGV